MSNKKRRKGQAAAARGRKRTRVEQATTRGGRRQWLWWIGGAVVLVVFVVFIISDIEGPVDPPEGVERFPVLDRSHTSDPVVYPHTPPVGGDHASIWQNCGFYSAQVASENAVHSLEHGAVWITYQPGLDEDSLDRLRRLAREPEVLVSAFPGLDVPVVASAWGNQMRFDSADHPDLERFVRSMKNRDAPEPEAGCRGGIGNPE